MLSCTAPEDTVRIFYSTLGIAMLYYLLGLAKRRKTILAYVCRFLLFRIQKYEDQLAWCVVPGHICMPFSSGLGAWASLALRLLLCKSIGLFKELLGEDCWKEQ